MSANRDFEGGRLDAQIVTSPRASASELAAIAAALEQFTSELAVVAPKTISKPPSAWLRAARLEAVGRSAPEATTWNESTHQTSGKTTAFQ